MIENTITTNENLVQVFCGVRGYEKDGVAYLHIEDVARGLGFTEQKDGVEYVRWRTVNSNLSSLAFATSCENGNPHDYYVPENIFYRLCMKAKNEVAEKFQAKVADEIIPSIRKTGSYSVTHAQVSRKDQLYLAIIHAESEAVRVDALKELAEINKQEVKALTAERDEAVRTKTQYQSNLAAQMSGRVGGLTTALNRVKLENDRLKGDRFTKEDVYIIMNTQGVSFTLKTVKDVIRESLNTISEYLDEPFPKIPTGERTDPNGKTFDVQSYVYTRKTVQAFFEYVENNPMGWQARNRKFILSEWLNHHMTIPA